MIVLMGVAGAGKSVQGHMLADKFGFDYVSTGQIIRQQLEANKLSEINEGKLLGDIEVIELLDNVLAGVGDKDHVIIDGFPRTKPQVDWLMGYCTKLAIDTPTVVNLTITEEVVKSRLLQRNRPDDNEESITYRFKSYNNVTKPIIEYMSQNAMKIIEINADQTPESVHGDIVKALDLAVN